MLVLPVGWVGSWLSLRMTVLSVALESAALGRRRCAAGSPAQTCSRRSPVIAVLAVVGLMGYSQLVALRETRSAAEDDAYTDPLTGARSRRYGLVRLRDRARPAAGRASPSRPALAMLDIDRFKLVNDVHGHPVGDEVLREVVRRVRVTLRAGDERDPLGR